MASRTAAGPAAPHGVRYLLRAALHRIVGMRAEPDDAVHGPTPDPPRQRQHRRNREVGRGSGDPLAGALHGSDPGRLVPGRRVPDPLPRQVAHHPPGHKASGRAQGARDHRCRGQSSDRGGGPVPEGRPPRRIRFLRMDRPRAPRRLPRRPGHPARPGVHRTGDRVVRRTRALPRRSAVAGRRQLREPPRHRPVGPALGHARHAEATRGLHGGGRSTVGRRLARRPTHRGPSVEGHLRQVLLAPAAGCGLPIDVLLAARGGRPRGAGGARQARPQPFRLGHGRAVHQRPRRPARIPRRAPAEVVQRVRRDDQGAAHPLRSRDRTPDRLRSQQPPGRDPHAHGPRRHRPGGDPGRPERVVHRGPDSAGT